MSPIWQLWFRPSTKSKEKKMKRKQLLLLLLLFITAIFTTTGCKQDNMDDIKILVTNYPNEYITEKLEIKLQKMVQEKLNMKEEKIQKKTKIIYLLAGVIIALIILPSLVSVSSASPSASPFKYATFSIGVILYASLVIVIKSNKSTFDK